MEGAISVGLEEEGPCPERPGEALAYFQVEMTASCGGGLSMVWMVRGVPRWGRGSVQGLSDSDKWRELSEVHQFWPCGVDGTPQGWQILHILGWSMTSLSLCFYPSDVRRLTLLPDNSKSEKWAS